LITERYKDKLFFDFGICVEQDGRALNHGLLQSKVPGVNYLERSATTIVSGAVGR